MYPTTTATTPKPTAAAKPALASASGPVSTSALDHPDEQARQAVLDELEILDTLPDAAFDAITTVAAELMGVPMSAVSLIDRDRQWFKSVVGLEVTETPRSVAFCAHAILGDDPFVVPDAAEDARFATNPLVTGDPAIRSYAGIPISIDGSAPVGTLCAIDTEPRAFTSSQMHALRALAGQVETQLVMQRRLAELADANTKLDQFTSIASHDLRSPARAIGNLVDFLREDCGSELPEGAHRHLDAIEDRAMRMETLIDDLLAFARMSSATSDQDRVTVESAINDALAGLDWSTDTIVNVTIEDAAARATLPAVEGALCLRNLVGNAIKHNDKAEGQIEVRVAMTGTAVETAVIDNGPGIPEQYQPRLFEAFRRFQTDPEKFGSGIGLTIVDQIAKKHGGQITVVSAPGAGSTFSVVWPQ